MTQADRFERNLADWLAESALPRTPDYVDDILRQAWSTRQRPAWSFSERWLPMSVITLGRRTFKPLPWRMIALLAVLALLLAVALAIGVGSQPRLPAAYGVAANGLLALDENRDIVTLDPTSGSKRTIVGGPTIDTSPVFSRDGTRLAFQREIAGIPTLWVARADGSGQRQLKTDPLIDLGDTAWSPDGRSILLTSLVGGSRTISIVATDGSDAPRALNVGMPADGPTWRPPDGREILFRGHAPTGFGLFAIGPDGSGLRSVTPSDGSYEFAYMAPGWSPDGSMIVYQWAETLSSDRLGQRLYVIEADGGGRQQITSVESSLPSWSPDGTRVSFVNTGVGPVVTVAPVDGGGPSIETGPQGAGAVAWTPDGSQILYLAEGSGSPLMLDPAGGPSKPATWTSSSFPDWQRRAP